MPGLGSGSDRPPTVLHRVRWGHFNAAFTGRIGGVSVAPYAGANLAAHVGDAAMAVSTNRRLLSDLLGIAPEWAVVNQVHGSEVAVAAPGDCGDADAIVVSAPDLPAAIFTADCIPILITGRGAMALVHAGWRGLEAGVIQRAAARLPWPAEAAFLGPSIGSCCYQVGEDLAARFRSRFGEGVVRPGPRLDLRHAARRILMDECGVDLVAELGPCTHSVEFFSYRSDGPVTGRQALVAWIEP